MQLFGIDPHDDRLRIRALRATPPGRASADEKRRKVFSAALGQFDELLTAASSVGPASRPLPLYYALNQAGRAIAAAAQLPGRPWEPRLHGLSIRGPGDDGLQYTTISPQRTSDEMPGSFDVLAEVIRAPKLTASTALANVWAAIPGLDKPGLGAGCPRALPLEFDPSSAFATAAWLRHIEWLPADEAAKPQLHAFLTRHYPDSSAGLVIERIDSDETHGMAATRAQLSWKSPDGTPRTVYTAGARYLALTSVWLIPALNSGDVLPPILLWWCLLQAFSSLARYHPAEWTAALDPDKSRWAVPIERALSTALTVMPRLILATLAPGSIEL